MERVVLIVNANHDTPTMYLAAWAKSLLKKLNPADLVRYIEIEGDSVTRANLESAITAENPTLVLFHCHGTAESVLGFEFNILVSINDNAGILAGRDVHALSCQAGKLLGPQVVGVGAKSFIGYKEDFEFWHLNKQSDEERVLDPYAFPTLMPAFKAVEALLLGKSAKEAFDLSQRAFADSMLSLITSTNSNLNTMVAASTLQNKRHQVLLGDNMPIQLTMRPSS